MEGVPSTWGRERGGGKREVSLAWEGEAQPQHSGWDSISSAQMTFFHDVMTSEFILLQLLKTEIIFRKRVQKLKIIAFKFLL